MALTVLELQETRSVSESDGRATATRRFAVYDDASPITHPGPLVDLFGTAGLPEIGEPFPNSPALYAVGYDIRHVPDQAGVWEITFSYQNSEPTQYGTFTLGFNELTIDYAVEFRDAWRANPNLMYPVGGDPAPGSTDNPGGTPIDSAGIPTSVQHRTAVINFTETLDYNGLRNRSQFSRVARGRRNSAAFWGAAAGTCLYVGASAQRIGWNKYRLTHRIVEDSAYHMHQQPQRGPDGQPSLMMWPGGSAGARLVAESVFWVQPFGDKIDFSPLGVI